MGLDRLDINGKSSGPASALREDATLPREVYSLLAQANLLRMRGCWEEAVTRCMAALRLAPDSPSAQSLLGDIYENQGRYDDAVQWYRMALDASPDSPADRLKLDRLLQRQYAVARPEHLEVASEAVAESDAEQRTSGERRPGPVSLVRLLQDPEIALRYGAAAVAVLVCLVVLFAYAAVHRRAALAAFGLAPGQEVQAQPVVVPPTSGLPVVPAPIPRDTGEQAMLDALRGSSDLAAQGMTVTDVQFDPRAGHLSVTFGLHSGNGVTQATVLRSALRVVQAATAVSPSASLFTVRCLMLSGTDTGEAALAFVGDTSRSVLPVAGAAEPGDDQVQALWTNPWWSSQMPD